MNIEKPIVENVVITNGENERTFVHCPENVEGEDKTTSSASNWNKLLDTYEAYVNKYVSCMKKAIGGDINVLSECASLMEKTEELGEQLENASGTMTTKQIERYTKINMKMLEAASSGF